MLKTDQFQDLGVYIGRTTPIRKIGAACSDEARSINCEIVSCDAGNRLRGWGG
jgi:hypothetical protein